MKRIITLVLMLFFATICLGQTRVFFTDNRFMAHERVYITNNRFETRDWVYLTNNQWGATKKSHWVVVNSVWQSDKIIFIVNNRWEATRIIYLTNNPFETP
jgi:hypothetical protein